MDQTINHRHILVKEVMDAGLIHWTEVLSLECWNGLFS